jgi:biopolymer transport protein ExbD
MAFSLSSDGNGSSFGKSRFRGTATLSEINVVPFVDILLVLLVIFMLTAHVMEYGLEVEVPQVSREKQSPQVLPVISVSKRGDVYLGDKAVNLNLLAKELKTKFPKATDVYVRADSGLVWNVLAQVISELSEAKVKVRLVTRPTDAANRRR